MLSKKLLSNCCPARRFVQGITPGDYPEAITEANGFFPPHELLHTLPPPFEKLDEFAKTLPSRIREPNFRQQLEQLVIPNTTEANLPDEYLPLAASIFGVLAQVYWRFGGTDKVPPLPQSFQKAWDTVSKRMGRDNTPASKGTPCKNWLSIGDLHIYNFACLSSGKGYDVENMRLLVPLFDNPSERHFMTMFIQMNNEARQIVDASLQIQDGVVGDDPKKVCAGLARLGPIIDNVTTAFLKLTASDYGSARLDPFELARTTVSMLGPPEGLVESTISGLFAPFFIIIDEILGRTQFGSQNSRLLHDKWKFMPPVYQTFFAEMKKVGVKEYVQTHAHSVPALKHLYDAVNDSQNYFLETHIDKVSNVIGIGTFYTNRRATVAGLTHDGNTPDVDIIDALETARTERPPLQPISTATVIASPANKSRSLQYVSLTLDPPKRVLPGDKILVQPENTTEEMIAALKLITDEKASLDTMVEPNKAWRMFFIKHNPSEMKEGKIALKHLLQYIKLPEKSISTSDLLKHPPHPKRAYSVSGITQNEFGLAIQVRLTVKPMGKCSMALCTDSPKRVLVEVLKDTKFKLPRDKTSPIIMIGTGSGIAPFEAMIEEDEKLAPDRQRLLVLGYRKKADVPELTDQTPYELALSQEKEKKHVQDVLATKEEQLISMLFKEKTPTLHPSGKIYICGSPQMAESCRTVIIEQMKAHLKRYLPKTTPERTISAMALKYYRQCLARDVIVVETYTPEHRIPDQQLTLREFARMNHAEPDRYFIVNGIVYDAKNYKKEHPGGSGIIDRWCGLDATKAFLRVKGHVQTDKVRGMLGPYQVAVITSEEGLGEGHKQHLFLLAEERNRFSKDMSCSDITCYPALLRALQGHDRFQAFLEGYQTSLKDSGLDEELTQQIQATLTEYHATLEQLLETTPVFDEYGNCIDTRDNDIVLKSLEAYRQNIYKLNIKLLSNLQRITYTFDQKAPLGRVSIP